MGARPTNRELWVKIFTDLKLNPDTNVNFVTAKQVRQISEREARNMAYMDESSKVPSIFKSHSLFILPVSNGRYAIVRGEGYHELELNSIKFEDFQPSFPPGTSILDPEKSEGSAVSYAWNTGIISHITGQTSLLLGPPGRFALDPFDFRVDGNAELHQSGAQAEIDGFFYSSKAACLMEFKARECTDFLVRQLYYPYRHWSGRADRYRWDSVRPFFVDFTLDPLVFRFFEYGFTDPTDYESIKLVSARGVRVQATLRPFRGLLEIPVEKSLAELTPQADNMDRVLRVPFLVAQGQSNAFLLAETEEFTTRQSSYYRRAAEALGLVVRRGGEYDLTELGHKFVSSGPAERNELVTRQLASIPAIHEILDRISKGDGEPMTRSRIGRILQSHDPRIHGTTVPRRTMTVLSWLRWVQQTTGLLTVDATGTVRPTPRLVP
jgi:hypothetical protein